MERSRRYVACIILVNAEDTDSIQAWLDSHVDIDIHEVLIQGLYCYIFYTN